jgi:hypothetical protein
VITAIIPGMKNQILPRVKIAAPQIIPKISQFVIWRVSLILSIAPLIDFRE